MNRTCGGACRAPRTGCPSSSGATAPTRTRPSARQVLLPPLEPATVVARTGCPCSRSMTGAHEPVEPHHDAPPGGFAPARRAPRPRSSIVAPGRVANAYDASSGGRPATATPLRDHCRARLSARDRRGPHVVDLRPSRSRPPASSRLTPARPLLGSARGQEHLDRRGPGTRPCRCSATLHHTPPPCSAQPGPLVCDEHLTHRRDARLPPTPRPSPPEARGSPLLTSRPSIVVTPCARPRSRGPLRIKAPRCTPGRRPEVDALLRAPQSVDRPVHRSGVEHLRGRACGDAPRAIVDFPEPGRPGRSRPRRAVGRSSHLSPFTAHP